MTPKPTTREPKTTTKKPAERPAPVVPAGLATRPRFLETMLTKETKR